MEPTAVKSLLFEPPHDLENRFERGEFNAQQFHSQFCEQAGVEIEKVELLHALSDIFWVNGEALPVVTQLSAMGFPMAILSNTCEAHWQHALANYGFLGQFFSDAILSYEVQSMKPDAAIYEAAIGLAREQTGCQAGEIFFVDDRQENVDAACKAGMDAKLFTDPISLTRQLVSRGIPLV